ncbi:MAG: hypothetical protein Ct9H300mP27_10580 [Chloroflexota bacterium]|nr:MAG: hypothetical protein Ct9H300mP27_10580 [Chloroflexota bacterium]
MDSLVSRDTIKANQVLKDDDEVDLLYDQVYRKTLSFYAPKNPQTIQRETLTCSGQLMIWNESRDRATNIAKTCHFFWLPVRW